MKAQYFMRLFALYLLFFLSANSVFAQGNEGVDLTFNAVTSKQFIYDGFGGVRAVQPDGKIIISGNFRVVNGSYRNGIARLNSDGSTDTSFNCEQACNFNIGTVVIQPDGKILIAGAATTGTLSIRSARVARLNSDGSLDSSFTSSIDQQGNIVNSHGARVWAVQPDGKIYASRNTVGTHANITYFYRLNPNGSIDSSFPTMTFDSWGAGHVLAKLVLLPDGKLLISGSHNFGYIFRVNPDGTKDNTFESPTLTNSFQGNALGVGSFGFQPDGKLVFMGAFDFVNGVLRNGFARLNTNSSVDMSFEIPIFTRNKMEVLSNGKMLVSTPDTIFRFNADGTQDNSFVLPGGLRYVHSWTLDGSERILALVQFFGSDASKFVRLNSDGSLDSTFNPNVGTTGSVSAIGVQSDGKILFGGDFNYVHNAERNNITRVNADGSLDTTFNVGSGFDGKVNVIVPQTDGKILIGGLYNNYNGFGHANLIRLNSDGTVDTTFLPVVDNEVMTVVRQSDGKVLIGGIFSTVNGVNRRSLVRLNSDGSLDSTFNPFLSGGVIWSIAIQSDGKILIGGEFTGVNGFARNNLARLNSDGTTDLTFNASVSGIHKVAVQPDGKVLAKTVGTLRRLNSNGSLDSTFQQPSTGEAVIKTMFLQPDGSILIGGAFTTVNNIPRNRFARLSPNGGLDTTFVPSGANDEVLAITTQPDGKILAGGIFTSIGGVTRSSIARISAPAFRRVTNFDFDGDGKSDISVFRPSTNTWYIIQSSNLQYTQQEFGLSGDIVTPADFDGDGKTDIAIFRPSTGTWWYKSSIDSTFRAAQWGASGDIPLPSDFDGDGKADFIVYRPSNNFLYRLGSSGITSSIKFGLSGDIPVTGDFDGDGKSDPAIYRPSTGHWWWQSSVDNVQRATQWGVSTDKVAPADYDGDGKTDIAVYRQSTGVWYVLNSSNGSATILQFGVAEDKPIAADYDADGKADVAVFRPSTGVWYVLGSTSGFWGTSWGVSTDVPIPNAFVQ